MDKDDKFFNTIAYTLNSSLGRINCGLLRIKFKNDENI